MRQKAVVSSMAALLLVGLGLLVGFRLGADEAGTARAQAFEEEFSENASFEAARRADPNSVKALVDSARTYVGVERFEKASEAINRALVIAPVNADAYLVRGRIMQLTGDERTAFESYEKSIALNPNNPYALNNVAFIYIQHRRFEEAPPLLERAIAQKSDVAYFQNNLGIVYEQLGQHQKAVEAFQAALTIDPSYAKARTNMERVQKFLSEQKPDDTIGL